jgi:hypothetical protein
LPHARGAELKQHLRARGIRLTHQSDGRNFWEVAGEVVQLFERCPATLPDRKEDRVYRSLPDYPDDVRQRLSVEERKPTPACRIQSWALLGGDHGSNHGRRFGGWKGSAHGGLQR